MRYNYGLLVKKINIYLIYPFMSLLVYPTTDMKSYIAEMENKSDSVFYRNLPYQEYAEFVQSYNLTAIDSLNKLISNEGRDGGEFVGKLFNFYIDKELGRGSVDEELLEIVSIGDFLIKKDSVYSNNFTYKYIGLSILEDIYSQVSHRNRANCDAFWWQSNSLEIERAIVILRNHKMLVRSKVSKLCKGVIYLKRGEYKYIIYRLTSSYQDQLALVFGVILSVSLIFILRKRKLKSIERSL